MKKVDLKNRKTFYASDHLITELEARQPIGTILNFAYTDYGGTFFDKVVIKYFNEKHPEFIVSESTGWNGENAFLFGPIANEFYEATERYLLGFGDMEEYFYDMEYNETQTAWNNLLDSIQDCGTFDRDAVLCELNEHFAGYFSVTTQGLDFSEERVLDHLFEKGLLRKN